MCRSKLLLVAITIPLASAQAPHNPPAAPVPTPILAAKSVFLSNAGVDNISVSALTKSGDVNQAYNEVYAALRDWGRYRLTSSPADAELVFEIRFAAPMVDCGRNTSFAPQLELTIFDSRTHFILWRITEPVEGAIRKSKWARNFEGSMSNLIAALKAVAS